MSGCPSSRATHVGKPQNIEVPVAVGAEEIVPCDCSALRRPFRRISIKMELLIIDIADPLVDRPDSRSVQTL